MSTPYTLMRCRMKHLISCFKACKVPINEEDANEVEPKTSPIGDDRKHEKMKIETVVEKGGGEESPASWQTCESEEEDYIVFHFKDEDVIEERSLESWSDRNQNAGGNRPKVDAKSVDSETGEPSELIRDPLDVSSDSSTSSFAFPRMQNEWTGSPVLMPRPEVYKDFRNRRSKHVV